MAQTENLVQLQDNTVVVVADAGPLIHLDELDSIWLLADFNVVYVPEPVWLEVAYHRPGALTNPEVSLLKSKPRFIEQVSALREMYALHVGEYAALCQCFGLTHSILLTDDTAARLAAKTLEISAHGTIGLLIRAIRRHQLSGYQVIDLLKQIPERSSLHIRPALLRDIIQQTERNLRL
ncbi:Predicted nucleic acid-binding protein, contains PIN domain [Allochromatium warmingii]|uniref:Predicted nucleic acid-binding protein, contains PIN domain n=1 Tax=Allochromatium warmingii TaxID=61595 RepID=A0A1H3C112_ALLWA|nr:DNA-binding protein [Allochromatium warmingii]SDX47776.1 Predicted nucleic acid-binding protein, contains PIN domain [Allochromatium warmingii]